MAELTDRYPILSGHFELIGGRPMLVPGKGVASRAEFHDLSGGSEAECEEQTTRLTGEILWRPFDLYRGPLFRPFWIKQDRRAHVIGFAVHHLISDAISCGVLMQDLCGSLWPQLSDRSKAAGEPALGYEDYLLAMDEWMRQPASSALHERYAAQMIGAADAGLPELATATHLTTEPVALDQTIASRLRFVAQKLGTSTFCILLAALVLVFKQASKQDHVVFGRVIPGREFSGFRRSVGYFADRVYGSVDLSGNLRGADIIARTAEAVAASSRYQFIRSDFLMQRLNELGRWQAAPVINFRTDIARRSIDGSRQPSAPVERFEMSPPVSASKRANDVAIWLSLVDQETRITGFVKHGLASPLPVAEQFERALEQLTHD